MTSGVHLQVEEQYDDRGGPKGNFDLYRAVRQGGEWTPPVRLPAGINTEAFEYGPHVDPEGRFLYFSSSRGAYQQDVYRVPLVPLLERLAAIERSP